MPDYFFDTSVLVAYFGGEDTHSQDLVNEIVDGDKQGAISALTVAELWAAPIMEQAERKRERLAIISLLDVVSIDQAIGERGGELRRQLGLHLPDALIAACAERAGGDFETKDPHFERLLRSGIVKGEVY